jgi:hypothetical protein
MAKKNSAITKIARNATVKYPKLMLAQSSMTTSQLPEQMDWSLKFGYLSSAVPRTHGGLIPAIRGHGFAFSLAL